MKGAIRTDFILSAEIIVITLGTVAGATLVNQALVLSVIAIIMTIGVYGLVAGIVKLDDAGLYLNYYGAGVYLSGSVVVSSDNRKKHNEIELTKNLGSSSSN